MTSVNEEKDWILSIYIEERQCSTSGERGRVRVKGLYSVFTILLPNCSYILKLSEEVF
jgi:hypothetical protein